MFHKINQKGFAVIDALLILILAGLVAGTGYYVWHSKLEANTTLDKASKSAASSQVAYATAANAVAFRDKDGTLFNVSKLARTTDQQSIAAVLDEQCKPTTASSGAASGHVYLAVTSTPHLFDGTDPVHDFASDGRFARVNIGCYDQTAGQRPIGGASYYLHKTGTEWEFMTASQMVLPCSTWDGTGVRSVVVDQCLAPDGTLRAPKS